MFTKRDIDEHLERLWNMTEQKDLTLKRLEESLGVDYNKDVLQALIDDGYVTLSDDKKLAFTTKGETTARKIIRAHRLAERLLFDAMGMHKDFERGACEFEHTLADELIDGICTMLGHPNECPHGLPIPPGECCQRSAKTFESVVIHLTDMKVGQSGRIAYINTKEDFDLHRLNGLQLRPGAILKLHQTYPTYVVECEGANIAIDEAIAKSICVWQKQM